MVRSGWVPADSSRSDPDYAAPSDGVQPASLEEPGRGYLIIQVVIVSKDGKRTYKIGKVYSNPVRKDTDKDGLTDRQERKGLKNKKSRSVVGG